MTQHIQAAHPQSQSVTPGDEAPLLSTPSLEDSDPSFTRKRQRLDSGEPCAVPTRTPTPAASPQHKPAAASPALSPSPTTTGPQADMTIRSQQPSSEQPQIGARLPRDDVPQDDSSATLSDAASPPMLDLDDGEPVFVDQDDPSGSPPVVSIEDDEEDDDGDGQQFLQPVVDRSVERHYLDLPFAVNGNYMNVFHRFGDWLRQGMCLSTTGDWI
ncbi:hypothetical protein M011DRAFT_104796 [Sporormia fimetaria CBS 119925]|uniref:Uncharacterized protein n=1 Tax=Sporormia fimetaria CBS 119925 TaxID=1340428 RepID=A0A6A6VKR4_9PLEO|nr:hypothetical protein M011DRAFT_104796 [Sporormia fimetaria CBS 119925]